MRNDTGQVEFAVILLFFFYYFAVILLLGAEINAFFAERIRTTPEPLTAIVHEYTSHLQTSKEAIQEQAPPSHKDEQPKDIRPQSEARQQENQQAPEAGSQHMREQMQSPPANQSNHHRRHAHKDKQEFSSPGASTPLILIEALAGTALAFVVQFFNLKRKK